MIERNNHGITPLCASGKEKYISGAADFSAAAQRGHGFHTRLSGIQPEKGSIPIAWARPATASI